MGAGFKYSRRCRSRCIVYLDGPAGGGGTFIAAVPANVPRTEPVSGPHGFRFPIPSKYWDGSPHTLYVYGIASSGVGADNLVLSAAPQTFVLDSTVVRLDNGVIQFGVEPRCGGTLVEMSLQGRNFVNNADCTGRQVQAALYDGNAAYDACSGCEGIWGWDPVQGGDIHNFGSPLLAKRVTADSVYIATRPNEWYPDNKGGGPGRPVPVRRDDRADGFLRAGLSLCCATPLPITHLGSDTHASAVQEFPAVWVNQEYNRFVSYAGTTPWTGGAVSSDVLTVPGQAHPMRYVPEHWAALVNDQAVGLTVYVPQQYPVRGGSSACGNAGRIRVGGQLLPAARPVHVRAGELFSRGMSMSSPATTEQRGRISSRCTTDGTAGRHPSAFRLAGRAARQSRPSPVSSRSRGWVLDDVDGRARGGPGRRDARRHSRRTA